MKNKSIRVYPWLMFLCAFAFFAPLRLFSQTPFVLIFPLSPSDITLSATGQVANYVALWCPTNSPGTNWTEFALVPAGVSNIVMNPNMVPSPSDVIVHSISTNGIRSANTNYILYNTNYLWIYISNAYTAPPAPASFNITN